MCRLGVFLGGGVSVVRCGRLCVGAVGGYVVEVDIFGLGAVFFILCGTGLVFGSGGGLTGCILWCRDPVVVCRPDPRI